MYIFKFFNFYVQIKINNHGLNLIIVLIFRLIKMFNFFLFIYTANKSTNCLSYFYFKKYP